MNTKTLQDLTKDNNNHMVSSQKSKDWFLLEQVPQNGNWNEGLYIVEQWSKFGTRRGI